MGVPDLPPLPGVDPATAPSPGDPGYDDWIESVVFTPEGVDRMILWESLHRTPTERLRALQDWLDAGRPGRRADGPFRRGNSYR
jgi:hypothetical protein